MEKFTRGPWFAADASRKGGKPLVCTINAKNCVVSDFDVATDAKFDAALIAAAPEMYEMLNQVSELVDMDGGSAIDWILENTFDIRELLLKARGEK